MKVQLAGKVARKIGLLRQDRLGISYDRHKAKHTRIRDELPEYTTHLGVYDRCFKTASSRARVLDVGCGTGRYFRLFPDTELLVGVDPSSPMLEEARRAVSVETLRHPPLLVIGSADAIPLLPVSFDLVYSIGVLGQHVPASKPLFEYLLSFCTEGGLAVLSVLARDGKPHPEFCPASREELVACAPNCAYFKIETEEFYLPSINLRECFHIISLVR